MSIHLKGIKLADRKYQKPLIPLGGVFGMYIVLRGYCLGLIRGFIVFRRVIFSIISKLGND